MTNVNRIAHRCKGVLRAAAVMATFCFAGSENLFGAVASDVSGCSYSAQGEIFLDEFIPVDDPYQGTITRAFDYYVPPALNPPQPAMQPPLIIIFHGYTLSKEYILGTVGTEPGEETAYPWCRMMEYADQENFIICAPDGWVGSLGNRGWNDCVDAPVRHPLVDDVLFVQKIIEWFMRNGYNLDVNRIYAAGSSNGGGMALRLASELEFQIAAVASILSTVPVETELECNLPLAEVGILIMNGTNDPFVSYDAVQNGINYWLEYNDVTASPEYVKLPDDGWRNPELPSRNVWTDGSVYDKFNPVAGNRVEFYTIHGGGHYEPSKAEHYPNQSDMREYFLGTQCHDFETAQVVCDFFRPQILRGELRYQPISVQPFSGSGSGYISDTWVAERTGTTEGTYVFHDEAGFCALTATFSKACNLDTVENIGSLRIKVDCTDTSHSSRSLYLYRFGGLTPGWEIVHTTSVPVPGNIILEHSVTQDLSGIKGPNNEIVIGVSSTSENNQQHDLWIDYIEIGVTPISTQ